MLSITASLSTALTMSITVRAATVTAALLGNVCDCQSLALVFLAAETSKEDSDCGDRGTQAADRGDGRHRLITGARK